MIPHLAKLVSASVGFSAVLWDACLCTSDAGGSVRAVGARALNRFWISRDVLRVVAFAQVPMMWFIACLTAPQARNFIERQGIHLYDGERPFRYLGTNIYWLMEEASYGASFRTHVRTVLDSARDLGISVIRTWAFADDDGTEPHLQEAAGVFNADVFAALDFVVDEAAKRNMRLLLPLLNYWQDYGGVSAYERWRATAVGGSSSRKSLWQPTSDCPQFYTDTTSIRQYKAMVEAVVGHVSTLSGVALRDDPTIIGWEVSRKAGLWPLCVHA